jgi:hypothetical protein
MADITIRNLAESEKQAFEEALKKDEFSVEEKKFIKDAISSWDYVISFMSAERQLPTPDDDVSSREGKRWGYIRGSILNIVLAENLVLGEWSNLALGATVAETAKPAKAKKVVAKKASKAETESDDSNMSIAERFLAGVRGLRKKSDGSAAKPKADTEAKPKVDTAAKPKADTEAKPKNDSAASDEVL